MFNQFITKLICSRHYKFSYQFCCNFCLSLLIPPLPSKNWAISRRGEENYERTHSNAPSNATHRAQDFLDHTPDSPFVFPISSSSRERAVMQFWQEENCCKKSILLALRCVCVRLWEMCARISRSSLERIREQALELCVGVSIVELSLL